MARGGPQKNSFGAARPDKARKTTARALIAAGLFRQGIVPDNRPSDGASTWTPVDDLTGFCVCGVVRYDPSLRGRQSTGTGPTSSARFRDTRCRRVHATSKRAGAHPRQEGVEGARLSAPKTSAEPDHLAGHAQAISSGVRAPSRAGRRRRRQNCRPRPVPQVLQHERERLGPHQRDVTAATPGRAASIRDRLVLDATTTKSCARAQLGIVRSS